MKYFLHDTNAFADEKVTKVFMKYGYEGVGLFFCVLEKLAFQEKPIETAVLKTQLQIGKGLKKVWDYLLEVGLLTEINGEVFNDEILNVAEKYVIKKEKSRKRLSEWRANQELSENETHFNDVSKCVRNAPKEKKTKEKERKENDDKGNTTSSSLMVEQKETDNRRVLQAETQLEQQTPVVSSDNNINNNISLKEGVGIAELKTRAFKNVRFCLEFGGMGVPVEHLEGWLGAFNSWLEYTGETVKQERDYRAHFKSWLLKQPYKTADPRTYNAAHDKDTSAKVLHADAEEVMRKRYG